MAKKARSGLLRSPIQLAPPKKSNPIELAKTKPKPKPNCTCNKCKAEKAEKAVRVEKAERPERVQKTQEGICTTKCNDSVDVKIDVIPDVILKQIENQNRTSFEVEIEYESTPNCRIIKKEVLDVGKDGNPCGKAVTKYVLLVESDVKLNGPPKITQVGKPFCKYEMEVVVDTDQKIISSCKK